MKPWPVIVIYFRPTKNRRLKMERSFVLIKPDAIQRKFVGRIIQRLEEKGLELVGKNDAAR
jgi:hypothetical protein